MAIGDHTQVRTGECTDLSYVDVGLYDTPGYGSVYVLDAERPAIIDTGLGTSYELILDALDDLDIAREDVAVIAPTHVHLDHAGGAGYLAAACPNARVVTHGIGAPHLVDPSRLVDGTKKAVGSRWQYYAEPKPIPEDRITELEGGDEIDLGDHSLEVHHAPGHAPHHAIYHDPANDAIFTADAAGIYVPAREEIRPTTPPADFHLGNSLADIETMQGIDPSTLLFGHFGPRETGDALSTYAETLPEWVRAVANAREELPDDESVVEHFVERAETAEMAEVWGEEQAAAETAINVRGVLISLDRYGEDARP
ncbi:MBL fold metallo-hydrolase [Halobacteriales archaeon QS_3_64_16]|nr:MAG: MBL fold metallo-hydrolase [Halobacteriales archaeon QS_3_64_16]